MPATFHIRRAALLGRAAFPSGSRVSAIQEFSSSSKPSNGEPKPGQVESSSSSSQNRSKSIFGEPEATGKPENAGSRNAGLQQGTAPQGDNDNFYSVLSSATGPSTRERSFWNGFMQAPASSRTPTNASWDFLNDLNSSGSREASRDSGTTSFRKLRDSAEGFDFLTDAPDTPAQGAEKQAILEPDLGEKSIIHSASFKLLRDSFSKASTPYTQTPPETQSLNGFEQALGLGTGSQKSWLKPLDSRTLAEVEGGFYSTMDQIQKETKVLSFEDLGEKLRKVRPAKEQILSSATGMSFEELRVRLEKIEQMDLEVADQQAKVVQYKELTDSLDYLRPLNSPKALIARKQLTHQEMAFLNSMSARPGTRMKADYVPPKDHLLEKFYAEQQLSSKERLKLEITKLKKDFQMHEHDCGSSQVQIAILTARIKNLNRHMREGPNLRRDKHSKKGLNDMVQYRRRLLIYLRRRDWDTYCTVLTKLNLDDVKQDKRGKSKKKSEVKSSLVPKNFLQRSFLPVGSLEQA